MQHALSTRCLGGQRLTSAWLGRVWDAHIPLIELYCARQQFDYRDKTQISDLGHWFRDSQLKVHSAHSPVYNDSFSGRSGPTSHILITETTKSKRIPMVDEIKRAIEVAETIPFTYLVQHLGAEFDDFDERKLDAAFTSLEELNLFARQRGVEILLENMHSDLASAARLVHFNSITHLNLPYCFDTGHAHQGNGVVPEYELLQRGIKLLHLHDNNGLEDSHMQPLAAGAEGIDWPAFMNRLRRDRITAALVLETSGQPETAQPLSDAFRIFDQLENLKPLDPEEDHDHH